jgi:hypothetical protein
MTARARIERLLRAARVLSDPTTELGRRARAELPETTRLSPAGVELGLVDCLETRPDEAEVGALLAGVNPARRALVLLPANVFVAAHRALALALAASELVLVRPSRREPRFVELLAQAEPGLFHIVPDLTPEAGDAYWAYGGEVTLASVRSQLPAGVSFHAQGPGYGIAVIEREMVARATAIALARDIVPFDQRGCLSPRLAIVQGSLDDARVFAGHLAEALAFHEGLVPVGTLDAEERADAARFRDTAAYAGECFPAGSGTVAALPGSSRMLAPCGRNLVIFGATDAASAVAPMAAEITALGTAFRGEGARRLLEALPHARPSAVGAMQRPRFDGPVDRRAP